MVVVLLLALFLAFLFISTIKDSIETNKIIKETEESMERNDMRISELLTKERKYDAIHKHRKYKLPKGAYGRK